MTKETLRQHLGSMIMCCIINLQFCVLKKMCTCDNTNLILSSTNNIDTYIVNKRVKRRLVQDKNFENGENKYRKMDDQEMKPWGKQKEMNIQT